VLGIIAIALDFHFSSELNFQLVSRDEEFKIVSMHVSGETVINKPMQIITYAAFMVCIGLFCTQQSHAS
jgi:hypothetical protein